MRERGALSVAECRAALAERLRQRQSELETALTTRVHAISDPREVADPGYLLGLNKALVAAVEHRIAVLELGERRAPALPTALLAQARLDARDGVPLDTVLRRYAAGGALFVDFLVEEAEREAIPSAALRRLLGAQSTLFDQLVVAVSTEYAHELGKRPTSSAERRRECVKRLLAGELVDDSDLGYALDAQHLALMAQGAGAEELMRALAATLERRLLAVRREDEPTWGCWLGGRRPLSAEAAIGALASLPLNGAVVTVGEPGEGLAGWRFSHLQAKAALPVAASRGQSPLRYADVALIAAAGRDDVLAASLRQLYLTPLETMRDGGRAARETLRAYFAAERNISSTAAALGVDRRTVRNRIRAIEGLIGRSMRDAAADLEIAMRLDD